MTLTYPQIGNFKNSFCDYARHCTSLQLPNCKKNAICWTGTWTFGIYCSFTAAQFLSSYVSPAVHWPAAKSRCPSNFHSVDVSKSSCELSTLDWLWVDGLHMWFGLLLSLVNTCFSNWLSVCRIWAKFRVWRVWAQFWTLRLIPQFLPNSLAWIIALNLYSKASDFLRIITVNCLWSVLDLEFNLKTWKRFKHSHVTAGARFNSNHLAKTSKRPGLTNTSAEVWAYVKYIPNTSRDSSTSIVCEAMMAWVWPHTTNLLSYQGCGAGSSKPIAAFFWRIVSIVQKKTGDKLDSHVV